MDKGKKKGNNQEKFYGKIEGIKSEKCIERVDLVTNEGDRLPTDIEKHGTFQKKVDKEITRVEVRGKHDSLIASLQITNKKNSAKDPVIVDLNDQDPILLKRLRKADRRRRMRKQATIIVDRVISETQQINENFVSSRLLPTEIAKRNIQNAKSHSKEVENLKLKIKVDSEVLPRLKKIAATAKNNFHEACLKLNKYLQESNGGSNGNQNNHNLSTLLPQREAEGNENGSNAPSNEEASDEEESVRELSLQAARNSAIDAITEIFENHDPSDEDFRASLKNALSAYLAVELMGDSGVPSESLESNTHESSQLSTAPSDSPALYDFTSLRIALPSLWSSLFEQEALIRLDTTFRRNWRRYQNEQAWQLPQEIPANVQLEDLLDIADELGTDSQVPSEIAEFGFSLSEEEYSQFRILDRMIIRWAITDYNRVVNAGDPPSIEGPKQIPLSDLTEIPQNYPDSGLKYYSIPGSPLSASLVSSGAQNYVQVAEPMQGLPVREPDRMVVYDVVVDDEEERQILVPFVYEEEAESYYFLKPAYQQVGQAYRLPQADEQLKVRSNLYLMQLSTYKLAKRQEINNLIGNAIQSLQAGDDTLVDPSSMAESSIEALAQFLARNNDTYLNEWRAQNDLPLFLPWTKFFREDVRMPFDVFTPRSVNYGISLNYKQIWVPLSYQAGDLAATIPLAPGETRKYTKKTVVKKDRKEKELESSLKVIGDQSEDKGRVESEVVKNARKETKFATHAEASGSVGAFSFGGSTDQAVNAEDDIADTRKKMREATSKASQKFKQERKLDIETTESTTTDETSSGEISNPNNEIAVTYLFYELQRRYFTTEFLADVQPVVLVAADVPTPSEISESFLIQHDWILKRALLDDSYEEAFELLKDSQISRETEIGVRKRAVERQLEAVRETKEQLKSTTRLRDETLRDIDIAVDQLTEEKKTEGVMKFGESILTGGLSSLVGGGGASDFSESRIEAAKLQAEQAQEALQRLDREINRLRTRLEMASSALDEAISAYSDVVRETLRREQQILRLRVHIAQNILHYMQAIWEYKILDQRFFELYNIPVPKISGGISIAGSEDSDNNSKIVDLELTPDVEDETIPLHEIADLGNLLGFKGNYLIFPMKTCNPLTFHMAAPYLNSVFPEDKVNRLLAASGLVSKKAEEKVNDTTGGSLEDNGQSEDFGIDWQVVTVPSGLEHIEVLPDTHSVLEPFKLKHRHIDVNRALAETKQADAEAIRRLLRLIEGDYSDPDPVRNSLEIKRDDGSN